MAFCNSCGAPLGAGKFCNKCGAAVGASAAAPAATAQAVSTPVGAPAPSQGGGALKVILIVVGVIVLIGVLGVASVSFFVWRVAHNTHIRQQGDNVKVETPFGNVESTNDPDEAARNLGVAMYPGAQVLKDGTASATFGGIHTVTVNLETSDSPDKVAAFYNSKFPKAMVSATDQGRTTIVSNDHKDLITINIEAEDGRTKIHISKVTHKSDAESPPAN